MEKGRKFSWETGGRKGNTIYSPVLAGDRVFVTSGRDKILDGVNGVYF